MQLQSAAKRNNLYKLLILLFYCGLVCILIMRHENWRDEAQAWLMARDLDFIGLVKQMAYEGHPCLWHVILMPFAKMGLPYQTMNIISTAITFAAVALILWKCPLPLISKVLVLSTSTFLYYLPVISRSYCLVGLFLCLNAVLYERRHSHPLAYGLSIGLLVQTHIYLLGFAGALSMFWLGEAFANYRKDKDKKKLFAQGSGLMLPFLSLIALLVQLVGVNKSSAFNPKIMGLKGMIFAVCKHLYRYFVIPLEDMSAFGLCKAITVVFIVAFVCAIAICLRRRISEGLKPLIILVAAIGFQVIVSAFVYKMGIQKLSLIVVYVLWLLWVMWPHITASGLKRALYVVLVCICGVYIGGNHVVILEWKYAFSDSRECAKAVEMLIPEDAVILQTNNTNTADVLAYLEHRTFYSYATGEAESFATWYDYQPLITDYASLVEWAKGIDADAEDVYVIMCKDPKYNIFEDNLNGLMTDENLIYQTEQRVLDSRESYLIYRIPLQ